MKLLILVLFSFNLYAYDMTPIYSKVKKEYLPAIFLECGYDVTNTALFLKNLTQNEYNCLVSNASAAKSKIDKAKNKQVKYKQASAFIKSFACDSLSNDFDKNVCTYLKGGR